MNGASAFTLQPWPTISVHHVGADIGLAVRVLQHRAVRESVLHRRQHHRIMVDADHLDALVADPPQRRRRRHARQPRRGDDAVDLAAARGKQRVDLLVGFLGRAVDIGAAMLPETTAIRPPR